MISPKSQQSAGVPLGGSTAMPPAGVSPVAPAGDQAIAGSPYEAADRTNAKLMAWNPIIAPANNEVMSNKPLLDARGRDIVRNDGAVAGAITLAKDHVAGQQYLLNAKPETKVLFGREDPTWETEFQEEVETKFSLWAESQNNWPDASRQNSLTGLVRLGLGCFMLGGEVLGSSEWLPDDGRPFRSALLLLDPDRLSNPNFAPMLPNIVGGVERDQRGAPVAYHILDRHPGDFGLTRRRTRQHYWRRVMARKPNWGRANILHIFEQQRPDQARGLAALVSSLSEMKMLKEFRSVELQRAAVAATYAATLETDLPSGDVYTAMGVSESEENPTVEWSAAYLEAVSAYTEAAKALRMDGVKIPALMPGTKLNIRSPGAASPLGADFETSMLRHIAASLGISYEQLSRDFSKTNYSSGRAAMGETERRLAAVKKLVADGIASFIYRLWFEEAINARQIESVRGRRLPPFYEGLNADAYCACDWIGAGRGQVDEMKETQAAALRLRSGISTKEIEIARLHGGDWRRFSKQIAREMESDKKLGIPSVYITEPSAAENAASGSPRETAE